MIVFDGITLHNGDKVKILKPECKCTKDQIYRYYDKMTYVINDHHGRPTLIMLINIKTGEYEEAYKISKI